MNIDRSKASRLLAKSCAYIECGKPETARAYALQLMAYLGECIDGEAQLADRADSGETGGVR
jgi:hypothetical protein